MYVMWAQVRFGKPFQNYSNTSVFEHSGRVYTIAENNVPQEIDLQNLDTVGRHDFGGDWNTPCTSHPKVGSFAQQFKDSARS